MGGKKIKKKILCNRREQDNKISVNQNIMENYKSC